MTVGQHDIDTIEAEATEIARYRISAGERVVMGRQALDGVEVSDCPANGEGVVYQIDRGFGCFEQLTDFVGDYVRQAERLDEPLVSPAGMAAILAETDEFLLALQLGEGLV
jgi:hypothetical protein